MGNIERASVGSTVSADLTDPIHGKAQQRLLDRRVVEDQVVAVLQEGRIDLAEARHSGDQRDWMLLGNVIPEGVVWNPCVDFGVRIEAMISGCETSLFQAWQQ